MTSMQVINIHDAFAVVQYKIDSNLDKIKT